MNILICNDDGYLTPGIAVLARVAGEFANVHIVTPERDHSGVGNSLTLDRSLHIKRTQNGFYCVNGTPADCIHLGLHALPDFRLDLVFPGINNGTNMGDNTLYSGTVATTAKAYLAGIPAVAFSLSDCSERYRGTTEKAAWMIIDRLVKTPPKLPILWNVNIPAIASGEVQGIKITRLERRHHEQSIVPMRNPHNEPVYWIRPIDDISDHKGGTDFGECETGFITVTPLQIGLIDYAQLEDVVRFREGTVKAE